MIRTTLQNSVQNYARLRELHRQVVDRAMTTAVLFKQSRENVLKAFPEVIFVGNALCEAKGILGARFGEWLREGFPEMDNEKARLFEKKVRLFMSLAKNAGGLDTETPDGFRKILAALGIMDDLGPIATNLLAMN